MTPKQQRFVDEYLIDLNATQAAIRCGYAPGSADVTGARLLGNASIAEAVQKAMDARAERTDITADNVLKELAKIGFADIRSMFTDDGKLKRIEALDDRAAACISSIEVSSRRVPGSDKDDPEYEDVTKVRLWDKRAALVDVGKHLGMFKERVEHTGKDGGPIEIDQVAHDADAFTRTVAGLAARRGTGSSPQDTQH